MGRQDATSANLKAINNAPEPIDRLNLLGRWIGAKLQEMAAAEQRLDKRIETLTTTENSLKNLFDALKKQVTETQPVLKEMAQLRASALSSVEQIVRATKDRTAHALQVVPIDENIRRVEERLANKLVEYEEKVTQLMQQAEQGLVQRIGKLDEDLDTNVRAVTENMQQRLLSLQQNADAVANRADDQIRVTEGRVNEIARTADLQVQNTVSKLRMEFNGIVAPFEARLMNQVGEIETRITSEMSTIEETMKAQLNGFYLHLDQSGATLQNQLEQLADDFKQRAELTLTSSRKMVRQQIDAIEDEVRLAIPPILQGIDDRRASAERQCEAALAGMDEAMKIRVTELRRSGEATIQLIEGQFIDKLKLIRPQAQNAVDSVEKHVSQRLQAALNNARAHIELAERELADRVEDLRPRASAALQAAKTELSQQIASLESEANTATGWIEQRLSQRIDELTYRARKTVSDQIRDLDDASEKLRRHDSTERASNQSDQPLELDIRVENPNPQQRSNAA